MPIRLMRGPAEMIETAKACGKACGMRFRFFAEFFGLHLGWQPKFSASFRYFDQFEVGVVEIGWFIIIF